jgi:hypothetical protein
LRWEKKTWCLGKVIIRPTLDGKPSKRWGKFFSALLQSLIPLLGLAGEEVESSVTVVVMVALTSTSGSDGLGLDGLRLGLVHWLFSHRPLRCLVGNWGDVFWGVVVIHSHTGIATLLDVGLPREVALAHKVLHGVSGVVLTEELRLADARAVAQDVSLVLGHTSASNVAVSGHCIRVAR